MSSVETLVLDYSFLANRTQAQDNVDLAKLDATFASIVAKLNEIKAALDVSIREDDTLKDASIDPRHLSSEVYSEILALVNGTSAEPTSNT